jgi:hypothetical protein
MKKLYILLAITLFAIPLLSQESDFNKHFTGERLRMDLVFAGDANEQKIYLEGLTLEPLWSGIKSIKADSFNYGEFRVEVREGEQIIYTSGFNNLFQEWRTTQEAKTTQMAFTGSCRIPFPKTKVDVIFYERVKESGKFSQLAKFNIDPSDKLIRKEREHNFITDTIQYSGDPSEKVDILFIAEGYTEAEMGKFREDAKRFASYLFDTHPYKTRQDDFNIWAVESISEESGPDIPHKDIWKNTVASSNFYTFRTDRYLTAPDHKKVSTLASNSHCDAMYVIVNTDIYGGGGIYNYYGLSMADHQFASEVFVHEFGHSFAGLADEYYTSDVAYEGFYNLKVEPWEPNITTLVDFDSKWKKMIPPGTPQPTPSEVEYSTSTGLFEGGGYMAKGIYRPALDCRMKSNGAPGFCEACTAAINAMIDYYTK